MQIGKKNYLEKGFTILEVVASIVIITIILLSFFGLFVQSSKTGKNSEQIIDATYLAQLEMEQMYQISKIASIIDLEQKLKEMGYIKKSEAEYTKNITQYEIKLSFIQKTTYTNLYSVVIEVREENALKSKMENIYKWKVQ